MKGSKKQGPVGVSIARIIVLGRYTWEITMSTSVVLSLGSVGLSPEHEPMQTLKTFCLRFQNAIVTVSSAKTDVSMMLERKVQTDGEHVHHGSGRSCHSLLRGGHD